MPKEIQGFFNDEGKLEIWPSKPAKKRAVLTYIALKFNSGQNYSEKEVNEIIKAQCDYNDHVLLRRELFGHKILDRTIDGRKYWKVAI
ncbi:MAG: DUF2087 domain-containing protein [Chitinophagales bacterium]|nr:DUF2087 domain-containing protein [Chitinophagales bacterium]